MECSIQENHLVTFVRQLPTKPLLPGTWIYYGKSQSLIGRSTINVPCSIARSNYQRVYRYLKHPLILYYFLGEPLVLHIYAGLLVCVFLVFRVSDCQFVVTWCLGAPSFGSPATMKRRYRDLGHRLATGQTIAWNWLKIDRAATRGVNDHRLPKSARVRAGSQSKDIKDPTTRWIYLLDGNLNGRNSD